MRAIRWILGKVILFVDAATAPSSMQRSQDAQDRVDQQLTKLSIYEFNACPFCVKVRRELKRLNLNITRHDAKNDATHKNTLVNEGGKYQVPCLRIENDDSSIEWLYESDEIISYLQDRFASHT